MRLTDMESHLDGTGRGSGNLFETANMGGNAVEMSLKRGERERQLEIMVS